MTLNSLVDQKVYNETEHLEAQGGAIKALEWQNVLTVVKEVTVTFANGVITP